MSTRPKKQISKAILDGWRFLRRGQTKKGSWPGLAFTEVGSSAENHEALSPTPFPTALIARSLVSLSNLDASFFATDSKEPGHFRHFPHQEIMIACQKAADYLISQKDDKYLAWNYWEKGQPARSTIPPDLDDTALAFSAIKLWRPEAASGGELALLAHTLMAAEHKTGGPYNTWLTNFKKDSRWSDIDLGVNANIAAMLKLFGVRLKNLDAYFEKAALLGKLVSKYYQSPIVLLYFISKGYQGQKPEIFVKAIRNLRNKDGTWGSPLRTALAISALRGFGSRKTDKLFGAKAIMSILKNQRQSGRKAGSWPKEKFYFERGDSENLWFNGSESLTTALCLEALASAEDLEMVETRDGDDSPKTASYVYEEERRQTVREFLERARAISGEFAGMTERWSSRILSSGWIKQNLVLPYALADMLGIRVGLSTKRNLALGNLAGWIGYSAMDEIVDGEVSADLLPFANFCLRTMHESFQPCFSTRSYRTVKQILDKTDKAYADEQKQTLRPSVRSGKKVFPLTKIPKPYRSTADKSLGQTISGLGVLQLASSSREKSQALIEFYRNYLQAKQDNDDSEDLQADLSRGRITPIGSAVLVIFKKRFPKRKFYGIEKDKNAFLDIFWREIYPKLSVKMTNTIIRAEKAIARIGLKDESYFRQMTSRLRQSLLKTENDRREVDSFLKSY